MTNEQPQAPETARTLHRARKSFRIAAVAAWVWAAIVLGNTVLFKDEYEDIFVEAIGIVGLITLLGIGIYRGSRICILLVAAIALYTWSQLFQYFSWPEWVLALLFVLAIVGGFVGAVIYHRIRARQAA